MIAIPELADALAPLVALGTPPDATSLRPDNRLNAPPSPLVPLPTLALARPPRPPVAAPDPTRTLPLLPEVDAPALNTSRPLAAPAPALDVPIRSAPPLPVVPSPEPARRVPPVSVELRPDSRLKPPPDPLVPLPAPSRVAPPRPDEAAPDPTSSGTLLPSLDEPELNTSWLLAPPPPPFVVRTPHPRAAACGRPFARLDADAAARRPGASPRAQRRRATPAACSTTDGDARASWPALQRSVQSRGQPLAVPVLGRPGAKCQPAA